MFSLIKMILIKMLQIGKQIVYQINVRENRRCNQEWTIQRKPKE